MIDFIANYNCKHLILSLVNFSIDTKTLPDYFPKSNYISGTLQYHLETYQHLFVRW